jgi:hypothetical protein
MRLSLGSALCSVADTNSVVRDLRGVLLRGGPWRGCDTGPWRMRRVSGPTVAAREAAKARPFHRPGKGQRDEAAARDFRLSAAYGSASRS